MDVVTDLSFTRSVLYQLSPRVNAAFPMDKPELFRVFAAPVYDSSRNHHGQSGQRSATRAVFSGHTGNFWYIHILYPLMFPQPGPLVSSVRNPPALTSRHPATGYLFSRNLSINSSNVVESELLKLLPPRGYLTGS